MKTKFIGAVAMLALFGLVEPSSAHYGAIENPEHPRDGRIRPGEMKFHGGLGTNFQEVKFSVTEEVFIRYDFTFILAEGSDGIYPAAEVVEIEMPGELNPDGSESSSFVISIPIGSFREGHFSCDRGGYCAAFGVTQNFDMVQAVHDGLMSNQFEVAYTRESGNSDVIAKIDLESRPNGEPIPAVIQFLDCEMKALKAALNRLQ